MFFLIGYQLANQSQLSNQTNTHEEPEKQRESLEPRCPQMRNLDGHPTMTQHACLLLNRLADFGDNFKIDFRRKLATRERHIILDIGNESNLTKSYEKFGSWFTKPSYRLLLNHEQFEFDRFKQLSTYLHVVKDFTRVSKLIEKLVSQHSQDQLIWN